MGPVRAVLFDVDGTLVDTDAVHLAVFQEMLAPLGVDVTPQLFRDQVHGRSNSDIRRALLPEVEESEGEALFARKEELFRRRLQEDGAVPIRGIVALLDRLARRGIRVAAVTNAPRANAEVTLEQTGLRERFPVLIVAAECAAAKPDPAPYQAGMRALGVRPDEAIVAEDSPAGVRAAVAAGAAAVVGIRTQLDAPALLALGCSHTAGDFVEVAAMFEGTGVLGEAGDEGEEAACDWVMGIDVGTTAVKVAVADATGASRASAEAATDAYVDSCGDPARREQRLSAIWRAVAYAVLDVAPGVRARVGRVAVCGAMHGVALWRSGAAGLLCGVGASRLVTWEDGRGRGGAGDDDWRRRLGVPPPGYGAATLAWMAREGGGAAFRPYTACGTVGDWLTAALTGCGRDWGVCATNAHSMGWCSLQGQWEEARFEAAGVPASLLPPVLAPGSAVGAMTAAAAGALGLGCGNPPHVHVACGDHPASVYALLGGADSRALAVSVGTSAQLSLPVRPDALAAALGVPLWSEGGEEEEEAVCALRRDAPALELRPSLAGPHSGRLLVAASLNGGNTVAWLASCLASAARAVSLRVAHHASSTAPAAVIGAEGEKEKDEKDEGNAALWQRAALEEVVSSADAAMGSRGDASPPQCRPSLYGERHSDARAQWTGVRSDHGAGDVALALLQGLAAQWSALLPPSLARQCGCTHLVGTGGLWRRSAALRQAVARAYDLPMSSAGTEEEGPGAALGVARFVAALHASKAKES